MSVSVKLDMSGLDRLEREMPGRTDKAIGKVCFDAIAMMRGGMSAGVSAPGEFPGVDTGKLKNSLDAEKVQPYPNTMFRIHDGTDYGIILEYSSAFMAARPFFEPSIHDAIRNVPDELKRVFRP